MTQKEPCLHREAGEIDRARLKGIWSRWPRYRWDYQGRSRWEGWRAERFLGLGIAGALGAATFLELALMVNKAGPWFALISDLGFYPAGRILICLLTVINAWILDRWISSHTRGDRRLHLWVRILRPLMVGVPILGLATVPAWRWMDRTHPAWAFQRARPEAGVDLFLPSMPHPLLPCQAVAERWVRTRGQRLAWLTIWLIACQISPFLGGVSWLTGSGPLGPLQRKVLLVACAALHLTAVLCGVLYGRSQAHPSATRLRVLPWLLLLPGLGMLSIAVLHPASFHPREEGLLVQAVHDRRKVERMPVDPILDSARGAGDAELHKLAFFRLKALLLVLDAATLSWFAARLAGWNLGSVFTGSKNGAVFLAVLALPGLLLATAALAARWVDRWPALRELERHPYGRYLALVPVVLSSGLVVGSLLAYGHTNSAGLFLTAIGYAFLLLFVISVPLSALVGSPVHSDSTVVLWFLFCFEVVLLGELLRIEGVGSSLAEKMEVVFLLTPVLNLGLFLALGRWLLRPFKLRHLADRRLLRRDRAVLAGVTLTAALPLGGLFIPFWIYAHHCLWRGMERSWAATRS